jgi:hypothetical protein
VVYLQAATCDNRCLQCRQLGMYDPMDCMVARPYNWRRPQDCGHCCSAVSWAGPREAPPATCVGRIRGQ